MKILIEGSPLFWKPKTGIGEYTDQIVRRLVQYLHQDTFYISHLSFFKKDAARPIHASNVRYKTVRYFPTKAYNFLFRQNLNPPLDLLTFTHPDLVIYFNFLRHRLFFRAKSITVIHDLAFYYYPQYLKSRKFANSLKRAVTRAVAGADKLVTISENTKRDLVKIYGADPAKISVIYPAFDPETYKPASQSAVAKITKKYGITKPYLLFLGTLEPRKNIVGIINAYARLPEDFRNKYQLVLAGAPGWRYEQVEQAIKKVGSRNIILTGYVDLADKPGLYSGAELFLLPSHYEGWGMPILEAMACGTPVLTCHNSALPEAGGEAVFYVKDSHDVGAIAWGIETLVSDPVLRQKFRQAGLKRIKEFSWNKSATQMLELIHQVTG